MILFGFLNILCAKSDAELSELLDQVGQIKRDIIECCRRVYARGYVAANDGNLSVRVGEDRIVATPTGRSKGYVRDDELVTLDRSGNVVDGLHRPSTEMLMHLRIYDVRPDVRAVVHAHPVHATAFATANLALDRCVLAEVVTTLGSIPLAPYATPSTPELPSSIEDIIRHADACLLANHGVVTCGMDIYDAYYKMERVEHYAHIVFLARMLGGERVLSPGQVSKLEHIRSTYGTADAVHPGCMSCSEDCVGGDCTLFESKTVDDRVSRIIRDIISQQRL